MRIGTLTELRGSKKYCGLEENDTLNEALILILPSLTKNFIYYIVI